jgi:hypothetical protein
VSYRCEGLESWLEDQCHILIHEREEVSVHSFSARAQYLEHGDIIKSDQTEIIYISLEGKSRGYSSHLDSPGSDSIWKFQ